MRKRWSSVTAWSAALVGLTLGVALPGRAAAQSSERAWLGVTTQEITSDLREGLDYRGSGVLVTRVFADSPADRAGLEKGDVLVRFNSRTIDTPSELVDMVRGARVGQSVSLAIVRDGQRRNLTARLSARTVEDVEAPEAPEAPAPPRAPRAPRAPESRSEVFEWDGNTMELPEGLGLTMLRGRGRLGVQIQSLSEDMADALGVAGRKGVLVTDVVKDSPASKVGIRGGDVIAQVAGKDVEDVSDLQRELRDHEGKVSITLLRRGSRRTVEPDIGDRPQAMRWRVDRDGDRRVIRIPDVRRRVLRDQREDDSVRRELERTLRDRETSRDELERQLRELREEVRELRRMMEERRGN